MARSPMSENGQDLVDTHSTVSFIISSIDLIFIHTTPDATHTHLLKRLQMTSQIAYNQVLGLNGHVTLCHHLQHRSTVESDIRTGGLLNSFPPRMRLIRLLALATGQQTTFRPQTLCSLLPHEQDNRPPFMGQVPLHSLQLFLPQPRRIVSLLHPRYLFERWCPKHPWEILDDSSRLQ